MKRIAILQSNYIPWKGYFDLINMVDEFIFYDDIQYTKRDWRNRNKIKTPQGLKWLSIPVEVKGKYRQNINETKVSDKSWAKKHWMTLKYNYSKAKYFNEYQDIFEELYMGCDEDYLSLINYKFIKTINDILGIDTILRWSTDFDVISGQTERLLGICKDCDADIYLSGPAAKEYFDVELTNQENIQLEWMDYSGYHEYTQLNGDFDHRVSILDLIFNKGPNATKFMKSFD